MGLTPVGRLSASGLAPLAAIVSCCDMTTQFEQQMPFRYHVGVRVAAEHSEPERITAMLGLQPHRVSLKGEVPREMEHLGEKVRGVYERSHKWAASFEPLSLTEPLSACLKRLASHLHVHSEGLADLAKDADITLYIYAYPGSSVREPIDWAMLEAIRSEHPVGLSVNTYAQHETNRPVDASRPRNVS